MKALVVFCEGAHDVAFLYNLFKTLGFKSYSEIAEKMPKPFDKYFIQTIESVEYQNLKLQEMYPLLPEILKRDAHYILLYNIGGESRKDRAKKIILDFRDYNFSEEPDFFYGDSGISDFSYAFFYDADSKGIQKKVEAVKKEFKDVITDIDIVDHRKVYNSSFGTKIGLYVFSDTGAETGTVEDFILPLIKKKNEKLYRDVNKYLGGKFKFKPETERKKAFIGTAGQIKKPGKSNSVIIKEAGFLTTENINASGKCAEIKEFFNKFIED